MNELDIFREKIDKLDCEIAKLYAERLETVKKIGDYKKQNNIAVLNSEREQKVFENVTKCLGNGQKQYSDDVKHLYKYIMDYSKSKQEQK